MYPGISRTRWQQPAHPQYASPACQSQSGWFLLQEAQQQQWPPSGWIKDTNNAGDYTTITSPDQRVDITAPTYVSVPASTPSYMCTDGESPSQPPPARTNHFLPSPTYPLSRMADPELYFQAQETQRHMDQKPQTQTILRRSKQIAIGRWNSEEHQWFLKGLEMFQGPAWGEMARLIGTRTPTQVRTHAQKFVTKLARLNQTLPYFEAQIQKERARLVAQGASITLAAPSTSSVSLSATLSPSKHRVSISIQQSRKRLQEETSPTYAAAGQACYSLKTYDSKPPVYSDSAVGHSLVVSPLVANAWTSKDARQWPLTSPTSKAAVSLQQMHMGNRQQLQNTLDNDAQTDGNSLSPMNKLLDRPTAS